MSLLPDAVMDHTTPRDFCECWYTVRRNFDRWIQGPDRLWISRVVEVVGVRIFNSACSHSQKIRDYEVDGLDEMLANGRML